MKQSQHIFSFAQDLISADSESSYAEKIWAIYRLRHARKNLLTSAGIAGKMVYGVPKSWR